MKILIILPNWLGDAVMATAAIEALCSCHKDAQLTLVGSAISIAALKYHPKCTASYVDETKKSGNRFKATYRFAKEIGTHDMAITFRNQLHSSLLLYFTGTPLRAARRSWHARLFATHTPALSRDLHLSEQYTLLAQSLCDSQTLQAGKLQLYIPPHTFERPTLGINPGATYGSAKRWYPERFAAVAAQFADRYDIVIFGGPGETEMAAEIESALGQQGVANVENMAGKTTIEELCAAIGGLSLFLTNDSGPMHVAAAYQVPTLAIFGPTRHKETCQWKNPKNLIVRHDIPCAPCMKRECPLKHHECMKSITSEEVAAALETVAAAQ